jgi:hypothetical protein
VCRPPRQPPHRSVTPSDLRIFDSPGAAATVVMNAA